MLCQKCRKRNAQYHSSRIINNQLGLQLSRQQKEIKGMRALLDTIDTNALNLEQE